MISKSLHTLSRSLAFGFILLAAKPSHADPLDPNDFASYGTLGPGNYSIRDNNGSATLYSGNLSLFGAELSPNGIAVFSFDAINAGDITINTNEPVALLSRTDATFQSISVSPTSSSGPGQGSMGGEAYDPNSLRANSGFGGSGGGGFGTPGISGDDVLVTGTIFGTSYIAPGGAGGAPYGDLAKNLQMGSPGHESFGQGPGFGGGAIELGALATISIKSLISANGASPVDGSYGTIGNFGAGGGGGSGGAIYVHANTISFPGGSDPLSHFSVKGGNGGPSFLYGSPYGINFGAGGNGGEGRVLLQGQIISVPEPSTLLLSSLAALALLGESCRRRRNARG